MTTLQIQSSSGYYEAIDEFKHKWDVKCVVWLKFDKVYHGAHHFVRVFNVEVDSIDDDYKLLNALVEYLEDEDCVYEKEWLAGIQVLDVEPTCLTQFDENIAYYKEKNTVKAVLRGGWRYDLRERGVGTSVDRSWRGYYTKKLRKLKEYDKAEQERRYKKYLYANSGIELETTH